MKTKLSIMVLLGAWLLLWTSVPTQAIPILQVYSPGADAGDMGSDLDTWFTDISDPFDVWVIGAYKDDVTNIENGRLVISVPEGETGLITFNDIVQDPLPALVGSYDTKSQFGADSLNNHYPFQDNVSDFLVYDIWDFGNSEGPLYDYNASGSGTITLTSTYGEIKQYQISSDGYSMLHIDVIADVTVRDAVTSSLEINPGSHDLSAVPEPATILLLGTGLVGISLFGRKKFKK